MPADRDDDYGSGEHRATTDAMWAQSMSPATNRSWLPTGVVCVVTGVVSMIVNTAPHSFWTQRQTGLRMPEPGPAAVVAIVTILVDHRAGITTLRV